MNHEYIYNIQILDDIHNYFPDLLYNQQGFNNIQDVFRYIQLHIPYFHLYTLNRDRYRNFMNNDIQYPNIPPHWAVIRDNSHGQFASSMIRHIRRNNRILEQSNEENTYQPPHQLNSTIQNTRTSVETPSAVPVTPRITFRHSIIPSNIHTINDELGNALLSTITQLFPTASIPGINAEHLEPVIVRPTQHDINNSTVEEVWIQEESVLCTICQDNIFPGMIVRRLCQCEHCFHKECIDTWFERNVRCPICRNDIREPMDEDDMDTSP